MNVEKPPRSFAVLSVKGGSGGTAVAAHLAASAAAENRTALVDLDVRGGDLAGLFDVEARSTVLAIVDRLGDVDAAFLDGVAVRPRDGLFLFAQPFDPTELREISEQDVTSLLSVLSAHYPQVVVDAGSGFALTGFAACLAVERTLLVCTPTVAALRDARRVLAVFDRLGVDRGHVSLVVNQVERRAGLTAEEVEEQLEVAVLAEIRRDSQAWSSADRDGRLVWEVAPRSTAATDLSGLWSRLAGRARATWWR